MCRCCLYEYYVTVRLFIDYHSPCHCFTLVRPASGLCCVDQYRCCDPSTSPPPPETHQFAAILLLHTWPHPSSSSPGVPPSLRGQVWQFLISRYHTRNRPDFNCAPFSMEEYNQLCHEQTEYSHVIKIDLGMYPHSQTGGKGGKKHS